MSCGCFQRETAGFGTVTHGMKDHPDYGAWKAMRRRCNNPNVWNYKYYGALGIRVCERWDNFAAFVADMGPRPDGYTLDRIDSRGHYEPENCRWADGPTQAREKRAA